MVPFTIKMSPTKQRNRANDLHGYAKSLKEHKGYP